MNGFIDWDRDMVAAIGDYQLRIWPNVADGWTWYVYLAAPNALHTVAGGTAADEASARIDAERALFRRLDAYQGLAVAAELARLHRIETAACEVLASGQARYIGIADEWGDPREEYVGDLVPADAMRALREAVEDSAERVAAAAPPAAANAAPCPACRMVGSHKMDCTHPSALEWRRTMAGREVPLL